MINTIQKILGLTVMGVLCASTAIALPAPSGTVGTLPANSFGGSGIPTHHVMIDTYQGLTLGLSAHQRYSGPNLVNDGAGTFFANTGESAPGLATWNFAFYINNSDPSGLAGYTYKLSAHNASTSIAFSPLMYVDNKPLGSSTTAGNSQNLGFFPFNIGLSFDPFANADYAFVLEAFSLTDSTQSSPLAQSAINVRVGTGSSVPDAGSTLAFLGVAFAGAAAMRPKFASKK